MEYCPTCFWWHVKYGIKRLNSWASQLPNRIEDNILKVFLEYRKKGILPPILNIPELKGFRLIDEQRHHRWKTLGIAELTFKDLVAFPDDVLTNGKKYILIDIKTIAKKPENCTEEVMKKEIEEYNYKMQFEFYNYVMRKMGYETEDFGYILFYYLGDIDNHSKIELKSKIIKVNLDLKNIDGKLKIAREILKKKSPPNEKCEFCMSHDERYGLKFKQQDEQDKLLNNLFL